MSSNVNSDAKSTECICPLCGARHMRLIYWTGRGKPRKYCENCTNRKVLRNNEDSEVLLAGSSTLGKQHWDPKKR